jgi:hypothetical protein
MCVYVCVSVCLTGATPYHEETRGGGREQTPRQTARQMR